MQNEWKMKRKYLPLILHKVKVNFGHKKKQKKKKKKAHLIIFQPKKNRKAISVGGRMMYLLDIGLSLKILF